MTEFTKNQIDEIASKLIIKNNNCILIYINICLLLFIIYIIINHTKYIKQNRDDIYKLQVELKNKSEKFIDFNYNTDTDVDPRYLVSRSEKHTDNSNLLQLTQVEKYSDGPEDVRLLKSLESE
jgi:hypothetical protein